MLNIIPLGGMGEIGLNMTVFECDDTIFILDAGMMFPEDYMLGVDYVIPDFDYIRKNRSKIAGVVLTHAHEDHIGALPYLLKEIDIPVFGTSFTIEIVKNKLEDTGIISKQLHKITSDDIIRLGSFKLEFIDVIHSVVGCVGVAIDSPDGLILHTGDFKIGKDSDAKFKTDIKKFKRFGEKCVLALMSDSTNVEKEGWTISDKEIGKTLKDLVLKSRGRIIFSTFASSIPRIIQIVEIAKDTGRKIVFNGKSIETSINIAKYLGYINIDLKMEISLERINCFNDNEIIIVTTGTQGEPMSALSRIAAGYHKHIKIKKQDTIILSSKFIPGNEKAIAGIINDLYRLGANVIYEKISAIHVSGHAFKEELKKMIELTNPNYFIPVHGEYRHLVLHGALAEDTGVKHENIIIAENGQVIEFDRSSGKISGSINTGRVFVDGKGIGDVGSRVLRERRLLSEEGLVVVNIAFDKDTGIIVYGPEVVSRGFVFKAQTGYLIEDAVCVILEIVEETEPQAPDRLNKIKRKLETALRNYFSFTINRKPVILPFIIEI